MATTASNAGEVPSDQSPAASVAAGEKQRRGSQGPAEEKLMVLKAGKNAGFVEYAYLAPKHLKRQFSAICATSIDAQTEYWLKSFVREFEGKINEVLELAEEFKAYLPDEADAGAATHIDAFQAHVFLERKGQTLSVLDLRAVMRNICADDNDVSRFSFIEYLAWSYQKTLKEVFMVKPGNLEGLLKGLYQAMHDYQESKAVHDAKTDELEEAMASSTSVVMQRVLASQMKEVLTRGCTRRKKDSVYHKYKQKKAQKQFDDRKASELAAQKVQDAADRKIKREKMAAKMGAMDSVAAGGGSIVAVA